MVAISSLLGFGAVFCGVVTVLVTILRRNIGYMTGIGLLIIVMSGSMLIDPSPTPDKIDHNTLILLALMATAPILGGIGGWWVRYTE